MIRFRNLEAFWNDVQVAFTNAVGDGVEGLNVAGEGENTIHEYAHFVTLGMRRDPRTQLGVYSRNARKIGKLLLHAQISNEIRALAAEVLIMRAADGFLNEDAFLACVGRLQGIPDLPRRVLWQTRFKQTERDARRVIAAIRRQAKRERERLRLWELKRKK